MITGNSDSTMNVEIAGRSPASSLRANPGINTSNYVHSENE
jgi:hypothetical protein